MQLATVTADQAETILAVLGAVVTARGTVEPTPADRAVIGAAADHLLGASNVPAELGGPIPGVVAERLTDPTTRDLTLAIATVLCFDDVDAEDDARQSGGLDPVRGMVVDDLARYLRASALQVVEVRRVAKQHHDLVALDLARRTALGGETPAVETHVDIDARRVHALWARIEQLPSGTVGAQLVRYYRDHGWTYPGTDHHLPLTLATHDVHHVLGGYPTTFAGEVAVGAFLAGAAARPVDGLLRFLTWVQLGAGTGPAAVTGTEDPVDVASWAAAYERGSSTTGDFVAPAWDPWAVVDRDLDALRAEYQIDAVVPPAGADVDDAGPATGGR